MQLSTTFRHMDASQAVRDYVVEKLDKIRKYFNKDPISAHAVFSVERGFNHVADINLTLPNGILINAKETTEDMYSSIDLATARIERQVRKWKDKIRDHKPHGAPGGSVREMVIPAEEMEPQAARVPAVTATAVAAAAEAAPGFRVIRDTTVATRSMKLQDAVMQLNLLGDDLLVFTDAENGGISVLYRRKDGNYGLVETGRSGSPS
ncbi:MAG TPA: ribosome-associated translation inhibitor RaiA [Polyangia bacterium]|jgi:putative sigma-54 modulation protein|nr:ribosome-associated translation inhibitor RaiA [Polyangia bacterium]